MIKIRIAVPDDAEELVNIYKYYVENTDVTFEYDVPTVEEFKNRIIKTLKKYPYLVAEEDGIILGYCYVSGLGERKAYDWSVETSIYIKHGVSGKGIGTLLYNELESYLKKQNITNMYACLTGSNKVSEAFHKKVGYKTVAYFNKCGYKFGQWKDVIWMEKFIGQHVDKPEDVIYFTELREN